jgi:formamidopyrimidine-DNA glycosylase
MKDPLLHQPICKMGPDCLDELPDQAHFSELMSKQRRSLKAVLLDQSILSGIGNWVADEVLPVLMEIFTALQEASLCHIVEFIPFLFDV